MSEVPNTTEVPAPDQRPAAPPRKPGWREQLSEVRPGIWLFLTLLVIALIYGVSLEGEFVWDDKGLIAAIERTLKEGSLGRIFQQPFWLTDELEVNGRNYYRPLTTLTFALDSLLHGRNSAGFRFTNLLLHLLNAALLFQLCRRLNPRAWLAALLVTVWALQPRLTESVSWISGRTDVLCTTFILGALLVWRPTFGGRVSSSLLLLLALLSKETALAGVLAVAALEWAQSDTSARKRARALLFPTFGFVGYLALRTWAMRGQTSQVDLLASQSRAVAVLDSTATYAQMLLDPWHPSAQIGSVSQPSHAGALVGAALLLVAALLALRYGKRLTKKQWSWMVLALIPLALVSHAIPIAMTVVAADRFLYLPTLALVLLALQCNCWSWRYSAVPPLLLGLSFVPVTLRRAPDWTCPLLLWTRTASQPSSRSNLALLEVGNLEFEAGNYDRALALFAYVQKHADSADSSRERAATNRTLAAVALGRYREAESLLEDVVVEHPRVPKFRYDLATMQLRNGDFPAARQSLEASLKLLPTYEQPASVLAVLSALEDHFRTLQSGKISLAERAVLETRLGHVREAEDHWLALLASIPIPSESLQDQALLFILENGSAKAVTQALQGAGAWQQRRPELVDALARKQSAAQRLQGVALRTYFAGP